MNLGNVILYLYITHFKIDYNNHSEVSHYLLISLILGTYKFILQHKIY